MKEHRISSIRIISIIIAAALLVIAVSVGIKSMHEQQPLFGGDRDVHGCIGSAGYSWCPQKEKCLRVWEEACVASSSQISEQETVRSRTKFTYIETTLQNPVDSLVFFVEGTYITVDFSRQIVSEFQTRTPSTEQGPDGGSETDIRYIARSGELVSLNKTSGIVQIIDISGKTLRTFNLKSLVPEQNIKYYSWISPSPHSPLVMVYGVGVTEEQDSLILLDLEKGSTTRNMFTRAKYIQPYQYYPTWKNKVPTLHVSGKECDTSIESETRLNSPDGKYVVSLIKNSAGYYFGEMCDVKLTSGIDVVDKGGKKMQVFMTELPIHIENISWLDKNTFLFSLTKYSSTHKEIIPGENVVEHTYGYFNVATNKFIEWDSQDETTMISFLKNLGYRVRTFIVENEGDLNTVTINDKISKLNTYYHFQNSNVVNGGYLLTETQ